MQPYHFGVADEGVGVLHPRMDLQLASVIGVRPEIGARPGIGVRSEATGLQ
jgi:hypothetical protein